MSLRSAGATRRLLPVLLLTSGFCGIAYEILYTKLLGNLLGNQFIINATVLLTFLLGLGFGTLMAHRWVKRLWLIELGIGLYAFLMATLNPQIDVFLYSQVPSLGISMTACAAVAFVLLFVPAFLIGCSVPLFSAYMSLIRDRDVFATTYAVYNVGAAATALAIQFLLLRLMGIREATMVLASINVLIALALRALGRSPAFVPPVALGRREFPLLILIALGVASVASAVFQLKMIKLFEFIFGPFNETFALVLATVLLGITLGSLAVRRWRLGFEGAMIMAMIGIILMLALFSTAVVGYAELFPSASRVYPLLVALKFGFVFVLSVLTVTGFGATVPALLRTHKNIARESGQLLAWSSFANAVGFMLMAFVLHRYFDYGPLLLIVAGTAAVALVLYSRRRLLMAVIAALLLAGAFVAHSFAWNETLLYLSHRNVQSRKTMQSALKHRVIAERYKDAQDVFAIVTIGMEDYLFINGYISIRLASKAEKIVGTISSMLSPRTDKALVLGVGSGATAGTVGKLFDHTNAVEINKVIIDNLDRMKKENFDIVNQPNLDVIHDDAIHYVKTNDQKYSLVLNTVTSPLYFSSSKLYTVDFFEMVKKRMAPDGIYVTWIDRSLDNAGFDIIMESVRKSFSDVWFVYIRSAYFLMICANQHIGLRSYDTVLANSTVMGYLNTDRFRAAALPYRIFSTDGLSLQLNRGARLNTLNYPALEYQMASLPGGSVTEFNKNLKESIDLIALKAEIDPVMKWSAGEFVLTLDQQVKRERSLSRSLLAAVEQQFGDVDEEYDMAAAKWAEGFNSIDGYMWAGDLVEERENYDLAEALFNRARDLDPSLAWVHARLGELALQQEDSSKALSYYERAWSLDSTNQQTGVQVAGLLLREGEPARALTVLESVNARRTDVELFRGQAFEKLVKIDRAIEHYEEALKISPRSTPAQEALDRLRS